tara:strand:- start:5572 stop:5802 length:231 start_codon:yes stop_codon:yes gene_type:complete
MNLLDQVRQVIAETINLPEADINELSSTETLDKWDSLAQVNLMMAIEQAFDLELEVEDFVELNSVRKIVEFINTSA